MSASRQQSEVIVHCTVAFPDITRVHEWLEDVGGTPAGNDAEAASRYVEAVLVVNSDWDRVPIDVYCSLTASRVTGGAL